MDNNENKKTPEKPVDEALADEALADEELDDVAGGKSVIIQNLKHGDQNDGGVV